LRDWIVKKTIEYLGEEEVTLTTFIVSKLDSACFPEDLLSELSMILDEDAEAFVTKLWRMVAFYSTKLELENKV
jgi:RNA-binding protein 25